MSDSAVNEVWYRAITLVEYEGARFEPGALVSARHPAVVAQPGSFERVIVGANGVVESIRDEPVYLSRPRPAVLMSDGSIEPIAAPPAPPLGLPAGATRPAGPEWVHLVRAHRATGKPRPKLGEVASRMGWDSDQPLRDLCRRLRIKRWYAVHALVASEPN